MNEYRKPYPNELYHYGVKGMKWRQHKYSSAYEELMAQRNAVKSKHEAKRDRRDNMLRKLGINPNREPSSGFKKGWENDKSARYLNDQLKTFTREGQADARAREQFEKDSILLSPRGIKSRLNPTKGIVEDTYDVLTRNHDKNSLKSKINRAASKRVDDDYRALRPAGPELYKRFKDPAKKLAKRGKKYLDERVSYITKRSPMSKAAHRVRSRRKKNR